MKLLIIASESDILPYWLPVQLLPVQSSEQLQGATLVLVMQKSTVLNRHNAFVQGSFSENGLSNFIVVHIYYRLIKIRS